MNKNLRKNNQKQTKPYFLENEKKYKNVNLFSDSNISNEISKLKENLQENKLFLDTYRSGFRINTRENLGKEKLKAIANLNSKENLFQKRNSLINLNISKYNKKPSKVIQNIAEPFFITKNENDFKKKSFNDFNFYTNENQPKYLNTTGQLNNYKNLTNFTEVNIFDNNNFASKTEYNTNHNNLRKKENDPEKIEQHYRKIFRKANNHKTLEEIHFAKLNEKEQKLKEIHKKIIKEENPPKYVDEKVKEIKSKLNFMKGVFDYAYPLIMVKRLKYQNIYFTACTNKIKQAEILKNQITKNSTKNFTDLYEYFETQKEKEELPEIKISKNPTAIFKKLSMTSRNFKKLNTFSHKTNEKKFTRIPFHRFTAVNSEVVTENIPDSYEVSSEESF